MEAPDTLYRQYVALLDLLGRPLHGVRHVELFAVHRVDVRPWTTLGAAYPLGVEPAEVPGILVVAAALRAEGILLHSCVLAVVGYRVHHREPRAAPGAAVPVVPVEPSRGVVDLAEAIPAYAEVGGYHAAPAFPPLTPPYSEAAQPLGLSLLYL